MTEATTIEGLAADLTAEQILDLIFKDAAIKHGLSEFDDLPKKPHQVFSIFSKTVAAGKANGEVRYYVKCLERNEDIQVYSEKKSCPEETLWETYPSKSVAKSA